MPGQTACVRGPPPVTHRPGTSRQLVYANACNRIYSPLLLIVPSASLVARAPALLGSAERCIYVPNGFDPQQFDWRTVDRQSLWHNILVAHPQGWRPGDIPGSAAYTADQVQTLATAPVLLYVGRFTALKRLDVLLRAYVRASPAFAAPAALVVVGGFPGEWESKHPYELIQELGAQRVFLAGWHDHAELPAIFAAADAVVLASAQEPFGQVLVEGMACGLPAIAMAAGGPSEIIADGQTGWLVPPDDEAAFAAALVSAVNDAHMRRVRGAAAYDAVHARYSWPALGAHVAHTTSRCSGRGQANTPSPSVSHLIVSDVVSRAHHKMELLVGNPKPRASWAGSARGIWCAPVVPEPLRTHRDPIWASISDAGHGLL